VDRVTRAEEAAHRTASLATRTRAGGCLQAASAKDLAAYQGVPHLLESMYVSQIPTGIFHTLLPEKVDTGGGVVPCCTSSRGRSTTDGTRADALAEKTVGSGHKV
jgi:hypothetical protein